MAQNADFAAVTTWRGVQNKPDFFPTNLDNIAQSGASQGQVAVWDNTAKKWKPANQTSTVSVEVGDTTTGAPGTDAEVTNVGTDTEVVLDFVIPEGEKGDQGDPGDPGTPGTDGATWYSGSGVPSGGLGANGDYYLRLGVTGNGDVYLKAAGAWSVVGNIEGPAGSLSGPAGGDLTGTYPNPTVNLLSALTSERHVPIGYATGGTVQIRFDLGSFDDLGLTVNASFSPAGSSGMAAGRYQLLVLRNTTAGALTLTWNGSWVIAGPALPVSLAAGQAIRVLLTCYSTTDAEVVASFWWNEPDIITPGSFTNADITVNAKGRITAATNGSAGFVNPMTTLGDIIYENATPAPARLAGNTAAYVKYLSQFGTGSVSAPPKWLLAPTFNVRDFGALGDASTDDIAAVNSAVSLCIAAGGGCIYGPAGTYKLSTKLTITKTANNQSITFRGDGCGVTKWWFFNTTDGVEIIDTVNQTEGASTSNSTTVEDMSICTSRTTSGQALYILGKNTNGTESGVLVRRITMEGYTSGCAWGGAIYLKDCPNFAVTDIRCVSTSGSTGNAITLDSSTAQTIGNFSRVNVQGFNRGFYIIGNDSYEGITLHACTVVAASIGLEWDTDSVEEQLNITDCHMATSSAWILASNIVRIFIVNANFHQRDPNASFAGITTDNQCRNFVATNSYFRVSDNVRAITLSGDNNMVHGNLFEGSTLASILINSGADYGNFFGNRQSVNGGGAPSGYGVVTDNGTGNQVFNNY